MIAASMFGVFTIPVLMRHFLQRVREVKMRRMKQSPAPASRSRLPMSPHSRVFAVQKNETRGDMTMRRLFGFS